MTPSIPGPRTVRVNPQRRAALYVISAGVWLTGVLWLIFHHFLAVPGEFGPRANPLEPWWLKLHGAFAFGAIWIFGVFWGIHVTAAWPFRKRRWSGGLVSTSFLLLSVTGYLLYYAGDDRFRSAISVMHWSIGVGAPAAYVWHRWSSVRQRMK